PVASLFFAHILAPRTHPSRRCNPGSSPPSHRSSWSHSSTSPTSPPHSKTSRANNGTSWLSASYDPPLPAVLALLYP
ncbi:Hypothetical predicted protein, partial [Prunus dulcis]